MYLSRFQIKQLREEKNMTQAKLAEIINIRQESLSRIELGRINPSIATLEKISDVLEVPISRLFKKNWAVKLLYMYHCDFLKSISLIFFIFQ